MPVSMETIFLVAQLKKLYFSSYVKYLYYADGVILSKTYLSATQVTPVTLKDYLLIYRLQLADLFVV